MLPKVNMKISLENDTFEIEKNSKGIISGLSGVCCSHPRLVHEHLLKCSCQLKVTAISAHGLSKHCWQLELS